jgi:hypothetical protein
MEHHTEESLKEFWKYETDVWKQHLKKQKRK